MIELSNEKLNYIKFGMRKTEEILWNFEKKNDEKSGKIWRYFINIWVLLRIFGELLVRFE